jgi:hypothetical protein
MEIIKRRCFSYGFQLLYLLSSNPLQDKADIFGLIFNSIDIIILILYRYTSLKHITVLVLLTTAISLLLLFAQINDSNIAIRLAIYKPGVRSKPYWLKQIAIRQTVLPNSQYILSNIRLLIRRIIHNLSCLKEAILKLYSFGLLVV